jgi:hypothetical protein
MHKSNWQRTVKRTQHRHRLAEIFADVGKCSADDILHHPFAKQGQLADPVDEKEEIPEADLEEELDESELDENELPEALRQAIAAMLAANPSLTKQEAAHHLLHTSKGRSLLAHLSKRKEAPPMPATYEDILKSGGGLEKVCKGIVEAGDSSGITEKQLTKLAEVESEKIRKAGETSAQAFSRYYQSEAALPLRQAILVAKGMHYGSAKGHGF